MARISGQSSSCLVAIVLAAFALLQTQLAEAHSVGEFKSQLVAQAGLRGDDMAVLYGFLSVDALSKESGEKTRGTKSKAENIYEFLNAELEFASHPYLKRNHVEIPDQGPDFVRIERGHVNGGIAFVFEFYSFLRNPERKFTEQYVGKLTVNFSLPESKKNDEPVGDHIRKYLSVGFETEKKANENLPPAKKEASVGVLAEVTRHLPRSEGKIFADSRRIGEIYKAIQNALGENFNAEQPSREKLQQEKSKRKLKKSASEKRASKEEQLWKEREARRDDCFGDLDDIFADCSPKHKTSTTRPDLGAWREQGVLGDEDEGEEEAKPTSFGFTVFVWHYDYRHASSVMGQLRLGFGQVEERIIGGYVALAQQEQKKAGKPGQSEVDMLLDAHQNLFPDIIQLPKQLTALRFEFQEQLKAPLSAKQTPKTGAASTAAGKVASTAGGKRGAFMRS